MTEIEQEIWAFLDRHLQSIFTKDLETYRATTSEDLSLFEWYITPHRQDGLDFHLFMVEHAGADGAFHLDILEPRLQLYGDTAVVSYTLMFSVAKDGHVTHRTHNESRVLIRREGAWQIVHVHKSPSWRAPYEPN
ncbi:MAG: nuclear transport factor 2 family protein [Ardenticatenaceae bacterium]|nr:nuclear transport factor 2 family protein [Ardenticatenaceae bacterium]